MFNKHRNYSLDCSKSSKLAKTNIYKFFPENLGILRQIFQEIFVGMVGKYNKNLFK